MSDRELLNLAYRKEWAALIEHLGKLDVGGGQRKILFKGFLRRCVFMVAAIYNAPAPVWKAIIEAALRVGLDLQSILTRVNRDNNTVLHIAAASSGDEVCCCLSVLCPLALDMKNYDNYTPLQLAKYLNRPSSVIAALTQAVNARAGFLKQQLEVRGGNTDTQTENRPATTRPPPCTCKVGLTHLLPNIIPYLAVGAISPPSQSNELLKSLLPAIRAASASSQAALLAGAPARIAKAGDDAVKALNSLSRVLSGASTRAKAEESERRSIEAEVLAARRVAETSAQAAASAAGAAFSAARAAAPKPGGEAKDAGGSKSLPPSSSSSPTSLPSSSSSSSSSASPSAEAKSSAPLPSSAPPVSKAEAKSPASKSSAPESKNKPSSSIPDIYYELESLSLTPQAPLTLEQKKAKYRVAGAIQEALATVDADHVKYTKVYEKARQLHDEDFGDLEDFISTMPFTKGKPRQPQVIDGESPLHLNNDYFFALSMAHEEVDAIIFREVEGVAAKLKRAFKPGPPKQADRCFEKARLCYDGDLSCLSDLRRASIVCPTVAAILEMLKLLSVTEGIDILRVKNRFSRDYSVKESGGYRDLQLNIRAEGTALIWELQIHLEAIEELKTSSGRSGHARYVVFRGMVERIKQGAF